jgi:repressor LexA
MAMALTRRQRDVLEVIRTFIARHGYSPSLEEIGRALGLSSVATVHKHVSHLVDKGLVRRAWNQNRSIDLIEEPRDAEAATELPLLGTIAAGSPLEAVRSEQAVSVPADMVPGGGRPGYVLRVRGDSMIDEQIRDGDLVVIEERPQARDGETVVALVDGHEATLKKLFREGATVRLQPANATLGPLILAADRVQVQGVVVGVIRKYA